MNEYNIKELNVKSFDTIIKYERLKKYIKSKDNDINDDMLKKYNISFNKHNDILDDNILNDMLKKYNKSFNKMKKINKYINKPDYSKVINKSV